MKEKREELKTSNLTVTRSTWYMRELRGVLDIFEGVLHSADLVIFLICHSLHWITLAVLHTTDGPQATFVQSPRKRGNVGFPSRTVDIVQSQTQRVQYDSEHCAGWILWNFAVF